MLRYFLLITFFSICSISYGQYRQSSGGLSDKIYFGGGGGFSASSNYINVSLSPLIGYKITDSFSAGVQVTYQYVKVNTFRANNYGGGPFLRYNITQKFFAYTQYEYMNFGIPVQPPNKGQRFDFNSMFVGLGYTEPLGDIAAFNVTVLYNLLYKDGSNSPYNSPFVFRVGFVAGLF